MFGLIYFAKKINSLEHHAVAGTVSGCGCHPADLGQQQKKSVLNGFAKLPYLYCKIYSTLFYASKVQFKKAWANTVVIDVEKPG